jgi:hypothetical protein
VSGYDGLFTQSGNDLSTESIYGLAQGNITRFENITKLNMHECLYALEFMKEKNELEAKRIKRNG